uniref:Uncharacterized protein n=1 Tax=Oryza sativa subsp. japonica TaxID=39947 RepID=Q6ERZ9_ORYSJ|nr:hypothetical protein [Oryza sativa Japonica Group]BAD28571.1 hypothetical protein [Oryza sativa Japonica Group]
MEMRGSHGNLQPDGARRDGRVAVATGGGGCGATALLRWVYGGRRGGMPMRMRGVT